MLLLAAAVSGQALVSSVLWLVVIGLIFWLLWWLIGYVGVPEPFNKVLRVIVAIVAVILLINFLLGLVGSPFIRW
jgi:hypothetical protein